MIRLSSVLLDPLAARSVGCVLALDKSARAALDAGLACGPSGDLLAQRLRVLERLEA